MAARGTFNMQLILLTALTMCAFAANSLLNRAGLVGGEIGPAGFAAVRLASGALVLGMLLAFRGQGAFRPASPNWRAIAALSAYVLGFSFAYVRLDAGLGALILFGGVQITMFCGAVLEGESFPLRRWIGMVVSILGLVVLVWPDEAVALPLAPLGLMVLAAFGWGAYSLIDRGIADPLTATAWNFIYSLPVALIIAAIYVPGEPFRGTGIALAVISGAVMSGLGYALWYRLLPQLGATTGALAQLTVPVIALIAAVGFLGEALTLRAILACALVCGGVAFGLIVPRQRQ